MPDRRNADALPAAYQGKEPSFIKHELLRAYLKRLFLIIGMSAQKLGITELCYVDGFAGPWLDESDDLGSTSIAISLGILDECKRELEEQGRPVRIRALYVEKEKAPFTRLERYLRERTPTGIEAKPLEGDFVNLQRTILDWCGSAAFAFFFLDPKGWKSVGVKALQSLLARPQSEFLITFMYDFVTRFMSKQDLETHMLDLLGEKPSVGELHGLGREKYVLSIYRRNLKQLMPAKVRWPARSAYVRVLDRARERTKYHLVYLTSHPHGITVFMEISEALEPVQKLVRASTKQASRIEKTGQGELWTAKDMADADEQPVDIAEVEQFWLERLSDQPIKFGEAEFADLLEETDWLPGDLQRALGNLIATGKVCNLDAEGKRISRFLHFEKKNGERLQMTGGKQ
ncbi:MAG: three-Cys-motif partner protein TcmP [Pseudomonadota bacterium]